MSRLSISKCKLCLMLADSFHKPGFKLHAKILHHLFSIVNSGVIKAPLWDEAAKGPNAYPNNAVFVHEYVNDLLSRSFPNLRDAQRQVGAPLACVTSTVLLARCLNLVACVCSPAVHCTLPKELLKDTEHRRLTGSDITAGHL